MKKNYLFVIMSLVIFACDDSKILEELTPNETSISIEQTKSAMDLDWDWTAEYFNAYCAESVTNTPLLIQGLKSPFFTNNCELAIDQDMHPEDGWMLVFKNLGSSSEIPVGDLPSFALYNKYSGVLRVMTYIPQILDSQYTYYLTTLKFALGSENSPLFTFYSTPYNSPVSNYDANVNVFCTGENYDYQNVWMYSDFILSGYDPNIQDKDIVFEYDIKGVEITEGEGTAEGTLEQVLSKKSVSGFWNTIDMLKNGVDTGVSFYKSVDGAIDAIDDIKSVSDSETTGTKVAATTIITAASAALGFVKGLIDSKNSSQIPIKFDVNLDIKLKLEQQSSLYNLKFALNSNSQNNVAIEPVQMIPWGVFNLKEIPTYILNEYEYFKEYNYTPFKKVFEQIVEVNTSEFLENIMHNPELNNVSYQVGYVKKRYSDEPKYFESFSTIASNTKTEYFDGTLVYYPDASIIELAIKVTHKYLHPVEGWKEVSIIKTYPITQGSRTYTRIENGGGGINPIIGPEI